jgi:hypothetical protein
MKASKITHRNETRIRVDFPYNAASTLKLKQIPDARWSRTIRAWHIPYTKEVFEQLKLLFPELEYITSNATENIPTLENKKVEKIPVVVNKKTTIESVASTFEKRAVLSVAVYPKIIEVKMPKDDTDIQFIRSFKYAQWNKSQFCWTVPNYGHNADLLKSYFGKNTDLRYIQSLLGHQSSKTTEIYTHITVKGFDQIKNPLDRLDIK